MTQTGWVADRLQALHPGLDVQLVPTAFPPIAERTQNLLLSTQAWQCLGPAQLPNLGAGPRGVRSRCT